MTAKTMIQHLRSVAALLCGGGLAVLALTGFAMAQNAGCSIVEVGSTGRSIIECKGGLTITAEKGAAYALLDQNRNGIVDAVRLSAKGLLLDLDAGRSEGLQVIAPQAIAAVRGTRWAVDAAGAKTSVFVIEGSVAVRRRAGAGRATLGPGEGVDVEAGSGALTVKRWPAPRVAALLNRFGE